MKIKDLENGQIYLALDGETMQQAINHPSLIWRNGFNRPLCSECNSVAKPSRIESNKWICVGCNEIIIGG